MKNIYSIDWMAIETLKYKYNKNNILLFVGMESDII